MFGTQTDDPVTKPEQWLDAEAGAWLHERRDPVTELGTFFEHIAMS